ncbi:MAG: IniB N-terminal domain-containing protein [Actinomycetota bacterium]|nr:IniB N-terminal domain-containing protein [Actinomycetota bacterium]
MSQSQSLVDFLQRLIRDGALRSEFGADPAATFADHGITGTSPQDIYEALVLIGDNEDLGRGFDRGAGAGHLPPPPPPQYFGDGDAQGAAIHYLDNYVTSGFDDDRGPFTGSSADHAPDSGGADPVEDPHYHQLTDPGAGHGFDDGMDHGQHGADPADHGGFDAYGI